MDFALLEREEEVLKVFDNVERKELGSLILSARPETVSTYNSSDYMFTLRTEEEKINNRLEGDDARAKLHLSLHPEWYNFNIMSVFGKLEKLHIDPAEVLDIEFDRDLGSLSRQFLKPTQPAKLLEREKRKVIDKLSFIESLDEMYLMAVSECFEIKKGKPRFFTLNLTMFFYSATVGVLAARDARKVHQP